MQGLGVGHGFGGAADFRFRHDFQQRRAGAVQVDAAHARVVFMQRLAGVFFQVGARQVDRLGDEFAILFIAEGQGAADDDGVFELADLVALGRIRIKIVFAREDRVRRDGGAHGQAEADRAVDGLLVHHGQHAWQGQVDGASLRIGVGAVLDRRTAENFGFGRELHVVLKTDDDFPLHSVLAYFLVAPPGRRVCSY
ncbi:hypothetical protein D3C72_1579850 [compost metagenome]